MWLDPSTVLQKQKSHANDANLIHGTQQPPKPNSLQPMQVLYKHAEIQSVFLWLWHASINRGASVGKTVALVFLYLTLHADLHIQCLRPADRSDQYFDASLFHYIHGQHNSAMFVLFLTGTCLVRPSLAQLQCAIAHAPAAAKLDNLS